MKDNLILWHSIAGIFCTVNKIIMKNKLSILFVTGLLTIVTCYGQDSARTINDKPGTPQSLRRPYNGPTNTIHTINTTVAPGQTINHNGTGSNQVNYRKQQIIIPHNNYNSKPVKPKSQIYSTNKPVKNPADINNKPPNVSDPIHK